MRALDAELVARGLRDEIRLMGGGLVENAGNPARTHYAWMQWIAANMGDVFDGWAQHVYWAYNDTGRLEYRLRDAWHLQNEVLPPEQRKPTYMMEYGVRGVATCGTNPSIANTYYAGDPACPEIWRTNIGAFQQLWFAIGSAQLGYTGAAKWDAFWGVYDRTKLPPQVYWTVGPPTEGSPLTPSYHALSLLFHTTVPGWQVVRVAPWDESDWGVATYGIEGHSSKDTPEKELAAYTGPNGELTILGLDTRGGALKRSLCRAAFSVQRRRPAFGHGVQPGALERDWQRGELVCRHGHDRRGGRRPLRGAAAGGVLADDRASFVIDDPGARTTRAPGSALAAHENRPAEPGSLRAEIVVASGEMASAHRRRIRVFRVLGEPLLERPPVETLVAVPVVLGGCDQAGQREAARLEALDSRHKVDETEGVRVGLMPERLADRNEAAGPDRRHERLRGVADVPPDEAGTKTERRVPRLGLDGVGGGIGRLDRHQAAEPALRDSRPRVVRELRAQLDALDPAAERLREHDRRPRLPAREIEHAARPVKAQVFAEEPDLLGACRVLDLVVALGDLPRPGHATPSSASSSSFVTVRQLRFVPAPLTPVFERSFASCELWSPPGCHE